MSFLFVLLICVTVFVLKHEKMDSSYRFGWGAFMIGFIVLYVLLELVF